MLLSPKPLSITSECYSGAWHDEFLTNALPQVRRKMPALAVLSSAGPFQAARECFFSTDDVHGPVHPHGSNARQKARTARELAIRASLEGAAGAEEAQQQTAL